MLILLTSRPDWVEISMELDQGRLRSSTFSDGKLSILEIGHNAYSGSEKGAVSWDLFKTARLADLQVSSPHPTLLAVRAVCFDLGLRLACSQVKPRSIAVKGADNAKKLRLEHALALPVSKHPIAAVQQSSKELKMFDHIRAFSSIFKELYPQRRQLFILPQNEAGIQKFVCTTIRPTQLAQLSVNSWKGASEFVARYFAFEPLQNPLQPPAFLPSPAAVIEWQVRDGMHFHCQRHTFQQVHCLQAAFQIMIHIQCCAGWRFL